MPLDPGADAVIEYLQTIPELAVTDESDTTVDGRPARQATVTATAGGGIAPSCGSGPSERRVVHHRRRPAARRRWTWTANTIVVTIYGEQENPELPDLADAIIGAFRFAATGEHLR